MMEREPLGTTGLEVSRLGLGGGMLGDPKLTDGEVERLLRGALDLGINLVDTAPSYGTSEARIGRAGLGREMLVSTKVGYGVEGVADWTGTAITCGIDQARRRLRRDQLDLVHLHSCPASTLTGGEVIEALAAAAEGESLRVPAYSGDGVDLDVALDHSVFRSIQATVSLVDRNNRPRLERARVQGWGRLGKRVLANAPWSSAAEPTTDDRRENWRRWKALGLDLGDDPADVFIRWATFHAGIDCALVGTRRLERLKAAVRSVERGPLEADVVGALEARWGAVGAAWVPLI